MKRGDTVTVHRYLTRGRPPKDAARVTLHGVVRKSNGMTVCVEIDGDAVWVQRSAEVEIANLWRLSGKAAEELTLLHEVRSKLFDLCAQRLREHEAP